MYSFNKTSAMVLTLLLAGCGGGGSDSGGGGVSPAKLSINSMITAPHTLAANSDGITEIKVTNPNLLTSMSALGATSDNNVVITGLSDQTKKTGSARVNLVLDSSQAVKAGEACWNGTTGATLKPGESCIQLIAITGSDGDQLGGNVAINAKTAEQGSDVSFNVPITTNFIPQNQLPDNASVETTTSIQLRPNAKATFRLNNPTQNDVNGAYIDLSALPQEVIDNFDWSSLTGGIFYQEKKRIIIPEIKGGRSQDVSFLVKGAVSDALANSKTAAQLNNNDVSAEPMIRISGANAKKQSAPKLAAKSLPFDATGSSINVSTEKDGTISLSIPNEAQKLVFKGIEGNLPDYISIVPSVNSGELVVPGSSINFTVQADARALSGEYSFTAVFSDESGYTYRIDLTTMLNAQTTLSLTNDMGNVMLRTNDTSKGRVTYLSLRNDGKFNTHIPDDLATIFSVSGGSMSVVNGQTDSCAGATLAPGDSCQIGIQSNSNSATLGAHYTLSAIANDHSNIKPGNITTLDLQTSPDQPQVTMSHSLPSIVNNDLPGFVRFQIANTSHEEIAINSLVYPNTGRWQCFDTDTEEPLASGMKLSAGQTRNVTCTITAGINTWISGALQIGFDNGSSYISPVFDSLFAAKAALTPNLQTVNAISFDAGDGINLTLENTGTTAAQNIKIDFSGLGTDFSQLISGSGYDSATGILSVSNGLLPGGTKKIHLNLKLSPTMLTALTEKKNAIIKNSDQSPVIKISSNNYADVHPAGSVSTNIINYEPSGLDYSAPGQKYLKISNPGTNNLSYSITNLPAGISIDAPTGTITAGNSATLTLTAANEVMPGTYTLDVNLKDEQQNDYLEQYAIDIAPATVDVYDTARVTAPTTPGESTTSDILLQNSDDGMNNAFSVFGISSASDAFKLLDQNGNEASSSDLEITEPTQGSSITNGIPDGGQAYIGLKVNKPKSDLSSAYYQLVVNTQDAGNLKAGHRVGIVVINQGYQNFLLDPIANLTDKVLEAKTITYKAHFTNTSNDAIKVISVAAPTPANFDQTNPSAGGNLWNGVTGATLNPLEGATLSFDVTPPGEQTNYTGDLTVTYKNMRTQEETTETITHFDTQSVANNEILTVNDGDSFNFAPNNTSTLHIASTSDLNHYYLDLSQMPAELYQHISAILIGGKSISLPESPAKIDAGYLFQGKSADMTITFDGQSEALLKKYQSDLADNNSTHYVAIGASNATEVYPSIQVNPKPITGSTIAEFTQPHHDVTVTFSNKTNYTFTLDPNPVIDQSLHGITLSQNTCGTTLTANESCNMIFQADTEAYGSSATGISLGYHDQAQNNFTAVIPVTITKPTVVMSAPSPLSIPAQDTSYDISLNNPSGFSLHALSGNISDYLSLDNLPNGMTLNPGSCGVPTLAPNASCSARLTLHNAVTADAYAVRLRANSSGNTLAQDALANFTVTAENKGSVEAVDNANTPISEIASKSSTKSTFSFSIKNVGNTNLQLSNTPVSYQWNQGEPTLIDPTIDASDCINKTLAINATCQVTITGVNQDPSITGDHFGVLTIHSTDGAPLEKNIPLRMTMMYQWLQISSGYYHTCAINYNHQLYCWGLNTSGQIGQSGNSTFTQPTQPQSVEGFDPDNIKQVALGSRTTYAITNDNKLYAWGQGVFWALGTGSVVATATPTQVSAGDEEFTPNAVKSVSAGYRNACALTTDNKLYCWGENNVYQLGRAGDTNSSSIPVQPDNTNGFSADDVTQVKVGDAHICAISNNNLYCWGHNTSGQLGIGTESDQEVPIKIKDNDGLSAGGVASFTLNRTSGYAIGSNGQLYSWGAGSFGKLGNNSGLGSLLPISVSNGNEGFTSAQVASLGEAQWASICAITTTGALYCWGIGSSGEMGNNTTTTSNLLPVAVYPGSEGFTPKSVSQVASGYAHTCALSSLGEMYCWGRNSEGELGIGNLESQSLPKRVFTPS